MICEAFLSLTAVGGAIALLFGFAAPPLEMLSGSVFSSYLIPGLALLILVGLGALAAMVLLSRKHRWSVQAALGSAATILIFETVEVISIGSPPGVARNLQILYFSLGGFVAVLAASHLFRNRRSMGNPS